ncbi:MAG: hypothetical protein SVE93_04650 [Candidatus Thermoplasmatota archaeon]|nr:hypothetical protein [Candidatus Thermoplasmatota archaeon]
MNNIFAFGYQNEASGKTTISIAIARALANSNLAAGVFKPVSAHNFWYQYDHTLRNSEAGTLFSEDIFKLANAAKSSEPYQLLNPVDRLISQPDIEKYVPPSPIDRVIAERITTYENGLKDFYLINDNAKNSLIFQSDVVHKIIGDKEVKVCGSFKEWDEIERKKLSEAIKTCYEKLCMSNEIVLVESYNNEIPVLLPGIKHALMVAPGKVFIYEGKEFSECFEANARAKGRTLGEEIFREIKPVHIMELSPLKREQLEDYDFLAREIGKPILETMDVL